MTTWAFLGAFTATALALLILWLVVRKKLRDLCYRLFGTTHFMTALSHADVQNQDHPRSLSGCDQLLIPQILEDFPDFDVTMAKNYARDYLKKKLADKNQLTIYNLVLSRYLRSAAQKTIVFQAAVSYYSGGEKLQKRFDLHYTYLLSGEASTVAANCPNCGGTLGYGDTVCPYCNSRVVNVMGNTWEFTFLKES